MTPTTDPLDDDLDEVFDLDLDDDSLPLEGEATRASTRVRLGGRVIDFPLFNEWPLAAVQMVTQREGSQPDILGAFQEILVGRPDDLAEVRRMPMRKAELLLDHVTSISGVSPGESSPSAPSSRSARRKSRRTSAPSTA